MNDDDCGDDVEYEDKDNSYIDDNSSLAVQIQRQRQEKTMIANFGKDKLFRFSTGARLVGSLV